MCACVRLYVCVCTTVRPRVYDCIRVRVRLYVQVNLVVSQGADPEITMWGVLKTPRAPLDASQKPPLTAFGGGRGLLKMSLASPA